MLARSQCRRARMMPSGTATFRRCGTRKLSAPECTTYSDSRLMSVTDRRMEVSGKRPATCADTTGSTRHDHDPAAHPRRSRVSLPPQRLRAPADAVAAALAQGTPRVGVLSALPLHSLSPAGCVDALIAWEKLTRHAHAGLVRALDAVARSTGSDRDLAEIEIGAALAWAPTTAQNRLEEAEALTRLFPDTLHHLVRRPHRRRAGPLPGATDRRPARRTPPEPSRHACCRACPARAPPVTRQAIRRAIVRADPHAAAQAPPASTRPPPRRTVPRRRRHGHSLVLSSGGHRPDGDAHPDRPRPVREAQEQKQQRQADAGPAPRRPAAGPAAPRSDRRQLHRREQAHHPRAGERRGRHRHPPGPEPRTRTPAPATARSARNRPAASHTHTPPAGASSSPPPTAPSSTPHRAPTHPAPPSNA